MTSMGFASQVNSSWGFSKSDDTTTKKLFNKVQNFTDALHLRMKCTHIECDDALKVIKRFDSEHAFFYVDPPYYNSDCGHYGGYSEDNFRELLVLLTKIKGKFFLSSYPSGLLQSYVKEAGWFQASIEQPVSVASNKTKKKIKVEMFTANYRIEL